MIRMLQLGPMGRSKVVRKSKCPMYYHVMFNICAIYEGYKENIASLSDPSVSDLM